MNNILILIISILGAILCIVLLIFAVGIISIKLNPTFRTMYEVQSLARKARRDIERINKDARKKQI